MAHDDAPQHPIGDFVAIDEYSEEARESLTAAVRSAPEALRRVLSGLTSEQLETKYRNWTIRQIAHHLGDSHLHSIIRFKWALTEENPLIKAYEESDWIRLPDCRQGKLEPTLLLLDGLHAKWVQLLDSMEVVDFQKTYRHPQSNQTHSLWWALNQYAWHGRHHTGQIRWLREQHGW